MENISLERDQHGHLVDRNAWDETIAAQLAAEGSITLRDEHWQVIEFLRNFYAEYEHIPPMRLLVKTIAQKLGPEIGNSPYLYTLFPDGPVKQGCKIAGLPKPPHCI